MSTSGNLAGLAPGVASSDALASEVTRATAAEGAKEPISLLENDVASKIGTGGPLDAMLNGAYVGRLVTAYGAVGGDATADTAAFQAAADANKGVIFVPEPPSGLPYEIDTQINLGADTTVVVWALGRSSKIPIHFTGTGYCFDVEASVSDVDHAVTDVIFRGINVDGQDNTTSLGAVRVNGAYKVLFDQFEARSFDNADAIGVDLYNVFNLTFEHSSCFTITNGTGIKVASDNAFQITQVKLTDFLLQRSAVNLDLAPGVLADGLVLEHGAIRANDSAIAVRCAGSWANMTFGPSLHIESETAPAGNTTTGFKFSGALFVTQVAFREVGFYNIKTLFDLDGSAGTLRDLSFEHIYATGQTGLAGTAFKLNGIQGQARFGDRNINGTYYTTLFSFSNVAAVHDTQAIPTASLPAASTQTRGRIIVVSDTGALSDTQRDLLRVDDGTALYRIMLASASGQTGYVPPTLRMLNGAYVIAGDSDPLGSASAPQGSIYLRSTGTAYAKASGGTGNTGWRALGSQERTSAQILSAADTCNASASHKWQGRMVYDTTNNRPLFASGSNPTDTWCDATGTVIYTPA